MREETKGALSCSKAREARGLTLAYSQAIETFACDYCNGYCNGYRNAKAIGDVAYSHPTFAYDYSALSLQRGNRGRKGEAQKQLRALVFNVATQMNFCLFLIRIRIKSRCAKANKRV
jgi:hypothetical protein